MKKSICLILLGLGITATTQAQNATNFSKASARLKEAIPFSKPSLMVDLRADSNAILILRVESTGPGPVTVRVTESSSGLVLEQTLRDHPYGLRLRFDNSTDGIYEIIVQAGRDIWRKTVTLQTSEVITRAFTF